MIKFRILLGMCLAMLFTATLSAQDKGGKSPEHRASKMTEMMTKKLDLSEEQKQKVQEANLELAELSMKNRDEMKVAMKKHEEELKSILSEEQYQKFKASKEKRNQRMEDRRKMRNEPRSAGDK